MEGHDAEQWVVLVELVRQAESPAESPALAALHGLALRTGISVLGRRFRALSDADREDIVSEKFVTELAAIVGASNPRSYFITAVVRAAIDAARRRQTQAKHLAELTRAATATVESQSEHSRTESMAMAACLETFSDRDQRILRAVAEGEDRERIAAVFGTSRANVDQVVSRARKRWEQSP